jgi:hypothetical protein
MTQEKTERLRQDIKAYFKNLPEDIYPANLKNGTSVFLSGSTGWGIQEGFDEKADWDLHLILEDGRHAQLVQKYGSDHVIDDKKNSPIVFGQIRSRSWLRERLDRLAQGDCTYTWIYNNCVMIQDPLGIARMAVENLELLRANLEELLKYHFVTFCVRRFDAASTAKRGIEAGARLANAEMSKAALQTMSLLHGKPYPYNKWLAKHVCILGEDGKRCVELVEKALKSASLEEIIGNAKVLRNFLEQEATQRLGAKPWITQWWKFNQNPPEIRWVDKHS